MAVSMKPTEQQTPATPEPVQQQPQMVQLELAKVERYLYGGRLYEKDKVYPFPASALPVLFAADQVDATGAPIWRRYVPKKNERLVARETVVERVVEAPGALVPPPVKTVADVVATPQVGEFINMEDDDPELAARLQQVDGAGQIDTGAETVSV